MKSIRLMSLAPGHFHAALVQKRMTDGVNRRCYVYGPLDADTLAHVSRLTEFNTRAGEPTAWEVDLRAGADWRDRFSHEQPGNTVVLSGRNRPKIDLMQLAVANGLHVIADKPWIIEAADFPKLEELYRDADLRDVLVWDVMTERHEVTNRLQRELIRDPDIFGRWLTGSPKQPALALNSMHFLKKTVAGRPLIRPWWWFDSAISGEAIADVGTHLADLAIWLIAPDQAIDYRADVNVLAAERWPLLLSEDQFRAVTQLPAYPRELAGQMVNEQLYYAGNNTVTFALAGVHVKLSTQWDFETPPGGGDTHESLALGTTARVEVRQSPGAWPEVFVNATNPADHRTLVGVLHAKCETLQREFPGVFIQDHGTEAKLMIPEKLRLGHEAHFAMVMEEFARYFLTPRAVPAWERPNTLAKYYITTMAIEMARAKRT